MRTFDVVLSDLAAVAAYAQLLGRPRRVLRLPYDIEPQRAEFLAWLKMHPLPDALRGVRIE